MKAQLAIGYTPRMWRTGKISFLTKPGKKILSDPRAYRPITLASFFFKTLERMVQWELESNEMKENPLHINQHAFQAGPSTHTAASSFADFTEEALSRKQTVLVAFIDIKGAFNNVNPDQAMTAIEKRGLPRWFTRW